MNTREAVKIILSNLEDDDAAIFTTGYISRYAFDIKDRDANFYMIGSMGLLSSVGLGIALNSDRKVFIFDGDGSILMDLGTMAMIASQKAHNLIHIALDNRVYNSTGGQPTISRNVDLSSLAKACGYKRTLKINSINELNKNCASIFSGSGPIFLHLKIRDKTPIGAGRITIDPWALSARFRNEITGKLR